MLIFVLALAGCDIPDAEAAPSEAALPAGKPIVNMGCFEESYADPVVSMGGSSGSSGYGSTTTGGPAPSYYPPSPPPTTTSPTPRPAPVADPEPAYEEMDDGSARRSPTPSKTKPSGAPKSPAGESAATDSLASGTVATTTAPRDERREMPVEVARATQSLDWGAEIYLSNDDSTSLASAQRVLWAVKNDQPISMRQIRPHELLNYFSFDTTAPSGSALFGVQGSAMKVDADTMTFAFAMKGASPPRKPMDLTMVVDRSGSMSDEGRMEYVKRGLHTSMGQLQRGDRVDIVMFDDQVCTPLQNWVQGRDDEQILSRVIDAMQPRGSTDVTIGLNEGYRIATAADRQVGTTRGHRVMLLTDALVNTGDIDPNTISEIGKAYEQHGVRLTGVGVGRDFDDTVLDMLTEKGKGAYVYVGSEAVVDRVFGPGFATLTQTIAHDVHFKLDLPESLAMERFYGEEASTVKEDVQPINYYAGTSQLFLQDLTVDPSKLSPSDPIKVTISYREAATGEPATQVWSTTVGALMEADPHNLNKGRSLMAWSDMLTARAMGADPCGQPLADWRERSATLGDDAEITYVGQMVRKWCPGYDPIAQTPSAPRSTVAYKVRVDSDVPIAEVALACTDGTLKSKLSGSDMVARFESASPGSCQIRLEGTVPMEASVQVPQTGGDVKCTIRGGRMSCG